MTSLSLSCTREGNGNPLQYSCLENPRDGGEIGFLKVCSILNSILMIYPRMLLAGRCHLEPQSSCDVRSPSAPTLKLREAVMRRQRVFLPCCLATRALGKPCSALSVKSGMCQKKHPRLVLWVGWNAFIICFYLEVGQLSQVSLGPGIVRGQSLASPAPRAPVVWVWGVIS